MSAVVKLGRREFLEIAAGAGAGLVLAVHLPGTAEAAAGRVTTIEGLSKSGDHPLQRAWVAEEVPQCGYCQSGQILAAAALLSRKPHPSDADVDEAMAGVLCRCGTYNRIRRAIHRAAGGGAR
jgi:isoquinoline 1-oxidoreductase alpha subunit